MEEKVLNIFSLCMQVSAKGNDCFFDYSPHVQKITVRIFDGKWEKGKMPYFNCDCYIDTDDLRFSSIESLLLKLASEG